MRRLILLLLVFPLLAACNQVYTRRPLISEAREQGDPEFRPGLWKVGGDKADDPLNCPFDIRKFRQQSLRQQISFVLQETVLFHGPIWQNIAYGKPEARRDEIVRSAELANATEFIERMTDGFNTIVGERGMTLSGGQRQRIAIARALIRNTPILILDEPTTGLDASSEKLVVEALERLMQGKTVITIAHRINTIMDYDR